MQHQYPSSNVPKHRCQFSEGSHSLCVHRPLRAVIVALSLCATLPVQAQSAKQADPAMPSAEAMAPNASLVERAMTLLGIPYRFGGNNPDTGFDCSGLVRFVFREALGVQLPGRADQIGKAGEHLDESGLLPGDLVFFNTLRRPLSHVGIYLGNRQFLHAPSTGGVVRIDKLDLPYWLKRFEGGRRMLQHENRAVTLPGVLPDKAHGSEVLVGADGSAGMGSLSDASGALTGGLGSSATLQSRKARGTGPAPLATSSQAAAPNEEASAAERLDQFIRKLAHKH